MTKSNPTKRPHSGQPIKRRPKLSQLSATTIVLFASITNIISRSHHQHAAFFLFAQAKCDNPCANQTSGSIQISDTNCGKYAQCSNGAVSQTFECNDPLIFDQKTGACNWAYDAECGPDPECIMSSPTMASVSTTRKPTMSPTMKNPPSELMGGSDGSGGSSPSESDDIVIVSLSMDVTGLGDDHDMKELEDQMFHVMERTVLQTSNRVPGLKVVKVERGIGKKNRNLLKTRRSLEQDITQYYNAHVIRNGSRQFGPIIIEGMRDDKNAIIQEIQGYTDTNFLGAIGINFCTIQNEKYDLCLIEKATPPTPVKAPSPAVVQSDQDDGGLAGWAIALIVIFVLLILCCIGYVVFVGFVKKNNENTNGALMDDRSKRKVRRKMKKITASGHDTIRGSGNGDEQMRREVPDAANTNGTKQRQGSNPPMYAHQEEGLPRRNSGIADGSSCNSGVLRITDGSSSRRYYSHDPPLKPKRDPTMYADGQRDPSTTYIDEGSSRDIKMPSQRTPSCKILLDDRAMYADGQRDPSTTYIDESSSRDIKMPSQRTPIFKILMDSLQREL